ncbi:MAG: hypothetical protein HUJ95_05090 [Bacteroidales bacterium]|nr:hypothetical protein [Bacteroidales bacterium]
MSLFTTRCTVIPAEYNTPGKERELLSEVVTLLSGEVVSVIEEAEENAVLIYSHDKDNSDRPEQHRLLVAARNVSEHTKILASYGEGILTLVVKDGAELRFCNAFEAVDFVTALYYTFLALSGMQINIAASTLYIGTPLSKEDKITALTYFKRVESL